MSLPEPLSTTSAAALEAILGSPSETLVASDFDGTLAPIVDDPEQAYADPDAVAALGRLGEHIGTVVVITGRPARTAVRLGRFREVAGLGSMIVLGQYGVERWDAAADEYRLPPNPPEISAVTDELPKILDSLGLGEARIEDKGRAVAVHIPARCRIRKVRSPPWPTRLLILLIGMDWCQHPARTSGRSAPLA
jgi:trehalose 6-phosphate phosphatase